MDHVQLPLDGLDAIDVPFVASFEFDAQDFESYPTRVGLPRLDDHAGWQEIDSARTASVVQSWLYFGLIRAFLNREWDQVSFEKFVANDAQGRPTVTAAPLLPLLDEWSVSAASRDLLEQERCRALLDLCSAALRRLSLLPQCAVSPLPEILLSVHLLVTTLTAVVSDGRLTLAELGSRPDITNPSESDPAAALLAQQLLTAGWCPWKIEQILSQYSYLTVYYISRLRDPTAPHISHRACTKERCIGNNVDMANYATRHTDSTCACPHSSVPDAKVRSIIANGGIPIVRVRSSRGGSVRLQVKQAAPQTRYIAISHVWSDGLGNPHANSLPQCQLMRLGQSVKLLAPPILDFAQGYVSIPQLNIGLDGKRLAIAWGATQWFWLDTLCIPVGSDEQSVLLKSIVINQMAAIYAGAHQVLVLDSVMQASHMAHRDPCHVLAQLSAIAWLGRCWTYQEGALALSLQVQCADCSFDPALFNDIARRDLDSNNTYFLLPGTTTAHSTWYRMKRAMFVGLDWTRTAASDLFRDILDLPPAPPKSNIRARLAKHIYSQINDVISREMCHSRRNKDPFSLSGNVLHDFVLCWNSLAQRTTTMGGDVHVIIANLLRLNAFSILAMKNHEERVRAVLWSLPGIPLSLLFNRSKERVRPTEQHANRWMPLWPDRFTITESPVLEMQKGVLMLAAAGAETEGPRPKLLMLDMLLETCQGPTELVVSDASGPDPECYRIVLHRRPADEFDSARFQSTVFLLHAVVSSRTERHLGDIPGACLHTNAILYKYPTLDGEMENSCQGNRTKEAQILTTYDCPATAHFLGSSLPSGHEHLPQYTATSPVNYTLAIEHGEHRSATKTGVQG